MEVFVVLKNLHKELLYPKASSQIELMKYVSDLAIVRFAEFLGDKYCVMLLYFLPRDSNRFLLAENILIINDQRYASKIFYEYRQFRTYLTNLEKRVFLVSGERGSSEWPGSVLKKYVGTHLATKVIEGRNLCLPDCSALLEQYNGVLLPGSVLRSILSLSSDPSEQDWFLVETLKKKTCLTNRKIEVFSQALPTGSKMFKLKLFGNLLEHLVELPRVRKFTIDANHHEKPTSRNYHASHQKAALTDSNQQSKSVFAVYYRFNHSKN